MDIQSVIAQLKDKFGDKVNVEKVKEMLHGQDLSKFSFSDIVAKVKSGGILGDLDGDGKQESLFEELKGKASSLFGKK